MGKFESPGVSVSGTDKWNPSFQKQKKCEIRIESSFTQNLFSALGRNRLKKSALSFPAKKTSALVSLLPFLFPGAWEMVPRSYKAIFKPPPPSPSFPIAK